MCSATETAAINLKANVPFCIFKRTESRSGCPAVFKLSQSRPSFRPGARQECSAAEAEIPSYRVPVDLGFAVNNSLLGTYQSV